MTRESFVTPSAATPAISPAPPVKLHIERLVLDPAAVVGLRMDAHGRGALQSALQEALRTSLEASLREGSVGATQPTALAQLRTRPLHLPAGQDATQLGQALARVLHDSLRDHLGPAR